MPKVPRASSSSALSKEAATSEDEAERIAELMERAGKAIFRAGMDKGGKMKPEAMTLTIAQMRCLHVLSREAPCTMGDLSRHLGVRPSTACELVDALVKAKMVSRESDLHDRRAVRLTLAPKGRRIKDKHRATRLARLRGVIETLSAKERRAIVGALETLSAVLSSEAHGD